MTPTPDQVTAAALQRCGGGCCICTNRAEHVRPIVTSGEGGPGWVTANLIAMCPPCSRAKAREEEAAAVPGPPRLASVCGLLDRWASCAQRCVVGSVCDDAGDDTPAELEAADRWSAAGRGYHRGARWPPGRRGRILARLAK
jgi:hypothetical protein